MCGILVDSSGRFSRERFLEALVHLRHRGPDAIDCNAEVGPSRLGHQRLKILDLNDSANQPFYSRSGRFAIVFNGEIYNFRELEARFRIPLRTGSDTELLVELFELLGEKALSYLDGMFAFAIADAETGGLFVARDRLGIKPLFYAPHGDGFIFASEVRALKSLLPSSDFDPTAIKQYRKLRGVFGGRTFYQGIHSFPSAHFLKDGRFSRYWDLSEGYRSAPVDRGELRQDVESAIRIREISDVPIGCFLSGGLDSSLISAISSADQLWTVGSPIENEFEPAERVSAFLGKRLTKVVVEDEQFLQTAREMIRQREEPLLVPNEVYIYELCKAAKPEVTVLLSGEGADELFAGYFRIFNWAKSVGRFSVRDFDQLYSYNKGSEMDTLEEVLEPYRKYESNPFELVTRFFIKEHLPGLLKRLDYSSMLAAVEVRCPFLDYRLYEKYWDASITDKLGSHEGKKCLKEMAAGLLPEDIIYRAKVGFPVDLRRILHVSDTGRSSYDLWFEFNLKALGVIG